MFAGPRLLAIGDPDRLDSEAVAELQTTKLELTKEATRQTGTPGGTEKLPPTLIRLAETALALGAPEQALKNLERAQQLQRDAADTLGRAETLFSIGEVHRAMKAWGKAIDAYAEAERAYTTANQTESSAYCWYCIGELKVRSGRPGGAREALDRALREFAKAENDLGRAHVLFRTAELQAESSPTAAKEFLSQARDCYVSADAVLFPDPGIRIANPTLPEHTDDLRTIEPYLMSNVCEHELRELDPPPARSLADDDEVTDAEDQAAATRRDLAIGAAGLLGTVTMFACLSMVALGRVEVTIGESNIVPTILGAAAAAVAALGYRLAGLRSTRLRLGAALAAGGLVFQTTSMLLNQDDRPAIAVAAIEISKPQVDRARVAAELEANAQAAVQRDDTELARADYQHGLEIYRRLRDDERAVGIDVALAQFELDQGNVDAALGHFEESLVLYGRLEDRAGVATVLAAIESIEDVDQDDTRVAQRYANQLRRLETVGDRAGQRDLLLRWADFEERAGRFPDARTVLIRLVELHERDRQPGEAATTLERVAKLDDQLGQDKAAIAHLDRALALYLHAQDPVGEAHVLEARADMSMASGQRQEAKDSYLRAMERLGTPGPDRDRMLLKVGDVERMMGKESAASARYQTVLETCTQRADKDCQGEALTRLAEVDAFNHRLDAALATYDRAEKLFIDTGNREGRTRALARQSILTHRNGDPTAAASLRQTALTLAISTESPDDRAKALIRVGKAAEIAGDRASAHDIYASALGIYETRQNVYGQIRVLSLLQYLDGQKGARPGSYRLRLAKLRGDPVAQKTAN